MSKEMIKVIKNLRGEKWEKVKFRSKTLSKNYYISNNGRVKSIDKKTKVEKLIKCTATKQGYLHASIKLADGFSGIYPHKKVAEHFLKQTSKKHEYVIHKDMVRSNNHHTNLKWVTKEKQKEYVKARAKKYGFDKRPHVAGVGNYKLKVADVARIKKMLAKGKTRRKIIAKQFNVSTTQLKRIERGENWAHVKPSK